MNALTALNLTRKEYLGYLYVPLLTPCLKETTQAELACPEIEDSPILSRNIKLGFK